MAQREDITAAFRAAMGTFEEGPVRSALARAFAPDAMVHLSHPMGEIPAAELYDRAYAPLFAAMPDLERRDWIVIAGRDDHGHEWVGCAGHYLGTFSAPFHDIPPTGHLAHMRFHEFYRVVEGRVVEVQAIWDVPELMMQAGAWPMAPSLGRELFVPGPATQDGLGPHTGEGAAAKTLVLDMLAHMGRHPAEGGPEVMEMARFWHPRFNWYGPAGIGSMRGVRGFRHWHQIPFLAAMPDRGSYKSLMTYHFFAQGEYVGVTGWPNMRQTLSHDGWMGIAPGGREVTMCSLDFWRVEDGMIRENWVLLDQLDLYRQLGVDVLARMREFNKARAGFDPETGRAA
ncbi:ester cyclase [Primorskyibacter sp. S187A]|uniref:nuclear transport factor 2 family protein n=1 Tax=Primorskyibacter sp. S187A TaxID=3415130 RepID=UPI003C7D2480